MTWGCDYASVDGNKPPNFAAFKAAGGSFVWIRGSFSYYDPGHASWITKGDPTFARDWKALGAAGLVRGAYLFPVLEATLNAREQVAVFKAAVDAAGGLRPGVDLPPCLDVEFPGKGIADTGRDRAGVLAWVRDAVAALRQTFGCWPIIYTSGRVWNDTDADCLGNPAAPDLVECPLWLARYAYATRQPAVLPPPEGPAPPVPSPWGDAWHAHQDQGDALGVPGFTATVDVDRFRAAKQGDRGGHVAWAQRKLKIAADGVLGPLTRQAIATYQHTHGLSVNDSVDLATFCSLAWVA
jgi:GH25 family lysozyme M1 (1,4-beta-N-acetylmuramidase)